MDKNNAIPLTLLGIDGRHKKRNPQADQRQQRGQSGKPRPHFSGQIIKVLRRRELEPMNHTCFHSREILKAAAVAKGEKKSESTSKADISDK